jgi:hypothetical protein
MLGLSYCCDFRDNPNYTVVSKNAILSLIKKKNSFRNTNRNKQKKTVTIQIQLFAGVLVVSNCR